MVYPLWQPLSHQHTVWLKLQIRTEEVTLSVDIKLELSWVAPLEDSMEKCLFTLRLGPPISHFIFTVWIYLQQKSIQTLCLSRGSSRSNKFWTISQECELHSLIRKAVCQIFLTQWKYFSKCPQIKYFWWWHIKLTISKALPPVILRSAATNTFTLAGLLHNNYSAKQLFHPPCGGAGCPPRVL